MRGPTRNANTSFLKQNTHRGVKSPSNFKGKVSHLLMPNTDLKHWQTQTTKTSRNELWFSVLVKNLKTQQEMRQRVCFVSPTGAYIKGKSLLFIAKSITQKKDLILPLPCPSSSSIPRSHVSGGAAPLKEPRSRSCQVQIKAEVCFFFFFFFKRNVPKPHLLYVICILPAPTASLPLGALSLKVFAGFLTLCCIYWYF